MSLKHKYLWNACLGNLFEHYDTALFGFLSPFLAPLLFPQEEPLNALLYTYAIIPLGMLARPLGAWFFGHIGDTYGRERSLFLTLAGMALVSCSMALMPLIPLLFLAGKALQNFFAAGGTMGGALLILENNPEKKHDLLSGLYNASAMGGHLLASFGVYAIGTYAFVDPGWRVLYLCGCVTAIFGCLIRRTAPPIKTVRPSLNLWEYKKPLLFIALCAGFGSACYSVALILMNGLLPMITTLTKAEVMKINTYLLVLDFCALPFFGWVASRISREKLMLTASLAVTVLAIPLFSLLEISSFAGVITIRILFVLLGVAFFAPFQAWAAQLVPTHARYTVISLGYALGSQALGSPMAAIGIWCFQKTGMVSSIAWYWVFLGLLSSASILLLSKRARFASAVG